MDDPINILIVDDEPKNLTVLETVLDDPNYRLVRAGSADQALLALVVEEFALLILDIRMPGMSGFELAEMIKERKKTARVPIIFLTAYYNEDRHVLAGYEIGAVDYLHKPVNAPILRSKVAVFAELHRKNREVAQANRALLAEVAERRRTEEQLRELNETLEQRVTERREAMSDSEMRYRRLFEAAQDGVLILDFDSGKVIDVNPFMTKLLGYSRDDLIGTELWNLGLFGDKSANEAAVRELQEKGYLRYEHLPLKSKSGQRVDVEVVANAYEENQEKVIQCNIRDISERNRLQAQLAEKATEVSALHRRKDEFLAMLSHELRSPLAPMSNAVQLLALQQASENPIQQQARNIIERQLGQLQHLVGDLLEVSRITSGRVQLRQERVAVSDIIHGAVETARPLIEQRQHELTVSLPTEPIWLQADAARLKQVIVNLLTNAAKYTEVEGHVELVVSEESGEWRVASDEKEDSDLHPSPLATHHSPVTTSSSPLTTPFVVIRVRDTGIGIAPELLPHIFDLFTQAERSLDRSQGGLGIGLALVQRLTELHGGTVEAHSTLGLGSEFIVRLPLGSGEQDNLKHAPFSSSSLASHHLPRATPLRVLVVDDNVDTVLSFSMLLCASGHEVQTAHDGLAAMQAALQFKPDVILLDIGLPGLNGHEVAKRIRQNPTLNHIALVALTGYGQDSDRQISQQAGFNHHLVKPARLDQLQTILAAVTEQMPSITSSN